MPRYGPFIHQVYIADGFADDCDELIHRCLSAEKFDYHVFCQIWKEMNMGCLYEGRNLGSEIAELSEEVIHIGKHYMLKDTSNFEESAIGVFIVYALLHLQPYKGFAHLRLVPEDLPAINRIEHVARRDKRYDVLYALGSILTKGPVQYHASEREHGMDLAVRKYLEGFTSIDKLGVRPKGVFRRQNEALDILKELDVTIQKYMQTKSMIAEKVKFTGDLKFADYDMPKKLEAALMKLITGIHEDHYGISRDGKGDDSDIISKSRRAIKEKAMKQGVNPVRHLVNVKNRKTSTVTNASLKKDAKKTSPNKPDTSKQKTTKDKTPNPKVQRKRRIPISPRALKNRKYTKTQNDEELTSDNDKSDTKDPVENSDENDETSLLPEKIEAATNDRNKKSKGKNMKKNEEENEKVIEEKQNVMENEAVDEQELDIEIDTLPVLIRTEEQGKLFEIEIIDSKAPIKKPTEEPPLRTYKKKESALKKISSLPDVSIEKIVEAQHTEPVASTSSANQLASIIGIDKERSKSRGEGSNTVQEKLGLGISNSKMEKRNCKRVHIQSKFKRLGMLPIANFNVPEGIVSEETDEIHEDDVDEPQVKIGLEQIED